MDRMVRQAVDDESTRPSSTDGIPLRFGEGRISGILTFFLGGARRLGTTGIALVWIAQGIGGANVYVDDFAQPG